MLTLYAAVRSRHYKLKARAYIICCIESACCCKRLKSKYTGDSPFSTAGSFVCIHINAMATASPSSSATSTATSNKPGELATDINETKGELKELKAAIKKGDEAAMKALGYDSRDEAKTALSRLEDRLNTYEQQKLALLQQQSGAGASMLLVH
jgi:uncharacterized protein YlxW (UPF0749 family)